MITIQTASLRRHPGAWLVGLFFLVSPGAMAAPSTNGPAWPAPPADPYIVFERSISGPKDIGARSSSVFTRFARWITGEKADAHNLSKPFGLSLDDHGNLIVTDAGSGQVLYLELAAKKWTAWKTIGKIPLASPVAAVRQGDTFFVVDSAYGTIIAFDIKGRLRFTITNELQRPSGLALSSDHLFVVDAAQHAVMIFDTAGKLTGKFGQRGRGPGEFNYPTHIAADKKGHLFVTDAMNYRIQVFDESGKFLREFGSAGDGPGRFSRPKGVATDSAGHVYVVDALFDNVQIFDDEARLLLDWGGSGSEPGKFWLPNAVAINAGNEIFVADSYNHRIQVFRYTGKK